jgi:thioredoxin reductase
MIRYILTDNLQRTTVSGVFACSDNSSPMRTVAKAVATGTAAGKAINKDLILEN